MLSARTSLHSCWRIIIPADTPKNIPVPEKELMTIDQFLAVYSISRSMFYSEVRKTKLKIVKVGTRTFVSKKNAQAWHNSLEEVVVK
jgi:hypothetical protein